MRRKGIQNILKMLFLTGLFSFYFQVTGYFYISEVNFRETVFMMFTVSVFGIIINNGTVSTSFHMSLY